MTNVSVSVIIVNRGLKGYLRNALLSLRKQGHLGLQAIVVDNGSCDGSVEMLKNDFPWVRVIVNEVNALYATAMNQGIAEAEGEFVLCLNNDAELGEGYIAACLKIMSDFPDVGMCCGKILRMDKRTIDSTGQFLSRSRRPYERGYREIDNGQYDIPGYVFGPCGAVAFYRRSMLEDVRIFFSTGRPGYFDEDYGMFYEDLDLAWRAQNRGWRAYYIPLAVAYHSRGASCQTENPVFLKGYDFACLSPVLQSHLIKNRYMTIIKNDSFLRFISDIFFILAYDLKLLSYAVFLRPSLLRDLFRNRGLLKKACLMRSVYAARAGKR